MLAAVNREWIAKAEAVDVISKWSNQKCGLIANRWHKNRRRAMPQGTITSGGGLRPSPPRQSAADCSTNVASVNVKSCDSLNS